MSVQSFYFPRLEPSHRKQVINLFHQIENDPTARHFHPHPFTDEYAIKICNYKGFNIYLGMFLESQMIGYGMLRGWDAGYQIPSLGIYISPEFRGQRISNIFMSEIHAIARKNRATRVRLKVYPSNIAAIKLYESFGYKFEPQKNKQLIGYYDLTSDKRIKL